MPLIVGADRIAANGDVANKIGTYTVAVLARQHDIPFYVAAPLSTLDLSIPDGSYIPIEQRTPTEVTHVGGTRIVPEGVSVFNPAFDVTPNAFVTAIITEAGVARAPYNQSLSKLMKADHPMLVLGIESSCDETASAVVKDGQRILSNVIHSQIKTHTPYGGVVPELASREHLQKIRGIVDQALADAGKTLDDMDGIAATAGPGLIGSLLVGLTYAKALAFSSRKPLAAVNHIEGHIYSVCFEHPHAEFPALALVVSGGHTNLFWVESLNGGLQTPHVQARWKNPRRRCRRSLRQSGQASGAAVSRRSGH